MRRLVGIAAASAAVAALVVPGLASGQGALRSSRSRRARASRIARTCSSSRNDARSRPRASTVSENGGPVSGLAVVPPGGAATGALLLIDASNSMKGAPLQGAMVAARAFLKERKPNMPVSVVVFGPDETVLAEFTTDGERAGRSGRQDARHVRGHPHLRRAHRGHRAVTDQGLRRATIVLLSDGTDVGSEASLAEAQEALAATNTRVYSVGLRCSAVRPGLPPERVPSQWWTLRGSRSARRARGDLHRDRHGSGLRVRGDVPLRAPTPGEGQRQGRRATA